jgi:uncharacterized protein (UPF0335 family)
VYLRREIILVVQTSIKKLRAQHIIIKFTYNYGENKMNENVSAAQLKLFIERVETLEEQKKGVSDDIKDVYQEAKGTGFDTKTMRQIVRLRKMERDARMEAEALLETYKESLNMD